MSKMIPFLALNCHYSIKYQVGVKWKTQILAKVCREQKLGGLLTKTNSVALMTAAFAIVTIELR